MATREAGQATGRRARRGQRGADHRPLLAVAPYFLVPDQILKRDFAKYLTVRIIEMLQGVPDIRVIAASTSLNLRANAAVEEIGRAVKADYVITGQIVRHDQSLSIVHRLYDVHNDELLLPFGIECQLDDLYGFERRLLTRIAADTVTPIREHRIEHVMSRRRGSNSAYELIVKAQVLMHRLERRQLSRARKCLELALAIEPRNATALAWLSRIYSFKVGQGWSRTPKDDARLALRLARKATKLDPENAIALATSGHVHAYLDKDFERAEAFLRRATDACPNEPLAWLLLAATLAYTGRGRQARRHVEFALTLSPLDGCLYGFYAFASLACYAEGDYRSAVRYAEQATLDNPRYSTTLKLQAAACVGLGRVAEAREIAKKLRALEPRYSYARALATPFQDQIVRELFARQLRTAGCFDRPAAA